jgi:outer membrane protein assembly factor BamD
MRHSLAVFLLLTLIACATDKESESDKLAKGLPAKDIYAQAKEQLDEGNYETAIKLYDVLQSRFPYGRYAQQAVLETAYANYRQREPEAAIVAADRFIKQFPNSANVDYAYYLKGLVNFKGEITVLDSISGQNPSERDPRAALDSFNAFKELVTRFPSSKYAADSTLRMKYLLNTLAQYELHVAKYYLRRGAYVAAENRAQGIIKQYPNSPATLDALTVMAQAYDAMGLTTLRDDANRVRDKNLALLSEVVKSGGLPPETLPTLRSKPEKPWWQFWK